MKESTIIRANLLKSLMMLIKEQIEEMFKRINDRLLNNQAKMQDVWREKEPSLEGAELRVYETLKAKGALGRSELCVYCELEPEVLQRVLFSLELNRWIVRRNDGLFEL